MSLPKIARAEKKLAGLRKSVKVYRDGRDIPYIEAKNRADLYLIQGYVTASDRLWQMDILRRTARGELSQIFGPATLEQDKRNRIYGLAQIAEEIAARATPALRLVFESYSLGVNAFIESCDEESLAPEFHLLHYRPSPWRPADSHAIGKIMAEMLSTTWPVDLIREALADLPCGLLNILMPQISPHDVILYGSDEVCADVSKGRAQIRAAVREVERAQLLSHLPGLIEKMQQPPERGPESRTERAAASNNWVVSGAHTATGKPLLANDPHMPSSAPSLWYMTHLNSPGLRVAGVTLPGVPGIIIGHNDRIAWGVTNLIADVQDIYAEKFDERKPRHYMTPEGWRKVCVRREKIYVRRSFDSTATDEQSFDVELTRHGPIVFRTNAAHYALRWTALDSSVTELKAFYKLNRARNWKDFCAALKDYQGPPQNFIYADTDGHIGYTAAGRIPIRKTGDGRLPFDGSTREGEWEGFIPFDKLPHDYDPASGIIVTANNRVVGTDYPYYLSSDWVAPYRAHRILELLRGRRALTIDDFSAIQADTYSMASIIFAREVVKAASEGAAAQDDIWLEALHTLDEWDGFVMPDSRAALLVAEMRDAFSRRILTHALGVERARIYRCGNIGTFIETVINERPRKWLPAEFKDYAELLRACLSDARAVLEKRLGRDESGWTWGQSVQVSFPHPLASVPSLSRQFTIALIPQKGSNDITGQTVNAGASVAMRLITDTSDWDETRQGIAPGESGDPESINWSNQLEDWRNCQPRRFPFTKSGVARAAVKATLFSPARDMKGDFSGYI